jgi:hypothetical protein
MPYATHVWHRLDPHKTFPRFALDAVAAALWSLSDLGILGPKQEFSTIKTASRKIKIVYMSF